MASGTAFVRITSSFKLPADANKRKGEEMKEHAKGNEIAAKQPKATEDPAQ
jgi:hypothetical protein